MNASLRTPCALALVLTTGCASVGWQPARAPRVAQLSVGKMDERTNFESERNNHELELSDPDGDGDGKKKGRVTPVLFWTGMLGTGGTIGFGVAGKLTEDKLEDGYEDGLTRAEERKLIDRGDTYNSLMIGSAAVGLVGLGVAALVYGIDYTRCGPLAPKKRRCDLRQ